MITYLIKMTLCALLFYTIYILLLENENRHRFKRVYLLASLLFSMLIPFIVFEIDAASIPELLKFFYINLTDAKVINQENQTFVTETAILHERQSEIFSPSMPGNYLIPILVVYTVITSLLLFRLIRNYRQMLMLCRKNECVNYLGAKIVLVDEQILPHSFGQYIFINRGNYMDGLVPEEIIRHEWAHVRQFHSVDVFIIELLVTFGWFNPIFYLYRNKIKQNHEYLADNNVVGNDLSKIPDYLSILFNVFPQPEKMSFISNFNYIITKKRIIMMTKTTTRKRVWCSSLALIPVFMVAICVFSTQTIAQNEMNVLHGQTIESAVAPASANNGTESSHLQEINKEQVRISGTVTNGEDGKPMPGVNVIVKGSHTGTVTDMDGKYAMDVPINAVLEFSYIGFTAQATFVGDQDMVINVRLSVKDESQHSSSQTVTVQMKKVSEASNDSSMQIIVQKINGSKKADGKPLWIVDSKIVTGKLDLDPNDIESITVIKDEKAIEKYGEMGKNGVVIVTTKK